MAGRTPSPSTSLSPRAQMRSRKRLQPLMEEVLSLIHISHGLGDDLDAFLYLPFQGNALGLGFGLHGAVGLSLIHI